MSKRTMLGKQITIASSAGLCRGGGTLAFLLLLGRAIGVESFGRFVYAFTVASILGLLIDYGFQIKLLTDISLKPSSVGTVVGKMLAIKGSAFLLMLTVVIAAVEGAVPSGWVPLEVAPLLAGYGMNSVLLSLYGPFKVLGRYLPDARIALIDAILLVSLALFIRHGGFSVRQIALGYATAKLLLLLVGVFEFQTVFSIKWPCIRSLFAELKQGWVYAAHVIVGSLYLNADIFIVRADANPFWLGIYQSGSRLVVGAGVFLTVVNAVFTPRFGRYMNFDRPRLSRELWIASFVIFCACLVGALIVQRWGGDLSVLLYGAEFRSLGPLLWIFCAVAGVRLWGAFFGIAITLDGGQSFRLIVGVISLVAIVTADYFLVPLYGVGAAAYVLLGVHVLILVFYVTRHVLGERGRIVADSRAGIC